MEEPRVCFLHGLHTALAIVSEGEGMVWEREKQKQDEERRGKKGKCLLVLDIQMKTKKWQGSG